MEAETVVILSRKCVLVLNQIDRANSSLIGFCRWLCSQVAIIIIDVVVKYGIHDFVMRKNMERASITKMKHELSDINMRLTESEMLGNMSVR